jgi:hypothetical protein
LQEHGCECIKNDMRNNVNVRYFKRMSVAKLWEIFT